MNKNLPTLPKSLLDVIGEYGMARTDGVSPLEVQHRWELLITGIKDYAVSQIDDVQLRDLMACLNTTEAYGVYMGQKVRIAMLEAALDERMPLTHQQLAKAFVAARISEDAACTCEHHLAIADAVQKALGICAKNAQDKRGQPVALSTLTDDDIEQFIYERCKRFMTADMIPAIRALTASAPAQQALKLCPHGRIQGRRCNDCQDESAQPMTPEAEPEVAHGAMCLCQLCVPPFNPAHDGALFLRTINEFMAADAQDAARYRWLREQDWFNGALCVVRDPQKADRLGFDCPSRARLDEFIDNAMAGTGSDESKKGEA